MYKVSVIVCVWNQQDLVLRALDSIPVRDDVEIIVVDDGSTDNTLSNVVAYITHHLDRHIKLITYDENKGLGYAKNQGFDAATGEYVTELDSDDYLYTDVWEKIVDSLDGSDITYQSLEANGGVMFTLNESTKHVYPSGCARFIRREFLGRHRCPHIRAKEDLALSEELYKHHPTERFTGLCGYHYNWPREGSLVWLDSRGLLK